VPKSVLGFCSKRAATPTGPGINALTCGWARVAFITSASPAKGRLPPANNSLRDFGFMVGSPLTFGTHHDLFPRHLPPLGHS